jgi:MFS transporter, ACS family, hexuronate transporter
MSSDLSNAPRSATWKWSVCGVLLLATMINYMDRQTLSQMAARISSELGLNNAHYANLEMGFGLAFAVGGIVSGLLVDKISVRWMYPLVVLGWSMAGFATAYSAQIGAWLIQIARALFGTVPTITGVTDDASQTYFGFLACRIALGFFEAGQWPCALVTTQRLLSRSERTFGNSVLQSGASIGAILTPLIVRFLTTPEHGSWRQPFIVIGAVGVAWVVPWFVLVNPTEDEAAAPDRLPRPVLIRRLAALALIVISINMTWHFFRAWMPKFLTESHGYNDATVQWFSSLYYIVTDVGCITVGIATRWLTGRGWQVHSARVLTFFTCAGITCLSLAVAIVPTGPLLLILLLFIGFGALGLFPNYYSFAQEISFRNQGKVTGFLSATTWVVTAGMHKLVGNWIDATQSYSRALTLAGLAPLIGCAALIFLWDRKPSR